MIWIDMIRISKTAQEAKSKQRYFFAVDDIILVLNITETTWNDNYETMSVIQNVIAGRPAYLCLWFRCCLSLLWGLYQPRHHCKSSASRFAQQFWLDLLSVCLTAALSFSPYFKHLELSMFGRYVIRTRNDLTNMKSNIIWICGRTLPIWNEETFLCFKSIFWDIILHLPSLLERTKGLSLCGQETEEYLGALNSRSAQNKNKTGRVSNQEIKSSLGELTTLARLNWIYRHWWRFTFSTCLHSILHLHL